MFALVVDTYMGVIFCLVGRVVFGGFVSYGAVCVFGWLAGAGVCFAVGGFASDVAFAVGAVDGVVRGDFCVTFVAYGDNVDDVGWWASDTVVLGEAVWAAAYGAVGGVVGCVTDFYLFGSDLAGFVGGELSDVGWVTADEFVSWEVFWVDCAFVGRVDACLAAFRVVV